MTTNGQRQGSWTHDPYDRKAIPDAQPKYYSWDEFPTAETCYQSLVLPSAPCTVVIQNIPHVSFNPMRFLYCVLAPMSSAAAHSIVRVSGVRGKGGHASMEFHHLFVTFINWESANQFKRFFDEHDAFVDVSGDAPMIFSDWRSHNSLPRQKARCRVSLPQHTKNEGCISVEFSKEKSRIPRSSIDPCRRVFVQPL